jgi:hypothetical protein
VCILAPLALSDFSNGRMSVTPKPRASSSYIPLRRSPRDSISAHPSAAFGTARIEMVTTSNSWCLLGAIRRRNGWRSFLAGCCRNRWLARHHAGDTPATTEDGGPDSSDLLRVAERPPRLGRLGSAKKSLSGVQMSGKALASGFSADPEPVASAIPLGYLPVASAIPLSYFFADPYFAVACRLAKVASTVASCCSSCCRLSRSRWTTSAGARSTKPALASLFCLPWI